MASNRARTEIDSVLGEKVLIVREHNQGLDWCAEMISSPSHWHRGENRTFKNFIMGCTQTFSGFEQHGVYGVARCQHCERWSII